MNEKKSSITCNVGELKHDTLLLEILLDVNGELRNHEYIQTKIDLLTLEKQKLENLRTLLIKYEYSLQFYNVLILCFKTLNTFTSVSQILQSASGMLMEPVITLLKSKKILLDNPFVRKAINYGITKTVEFFVRKKQIEKMLVTKMRHLKEHCSVTLDFVNQQGRILDTTKQCMGQEDISGIKSHMDSDVYMVLCELEKMSVQVRANLKIIDSLKESFLSSTSDILECEDVIDCDGICSLIQRSFDLSSINMVSIKMIMKYIVFVKNVKRQKIVVLFHALKNCLRDVCSEEDDPFIGVRDYIDIDNIKYDDIELYKKMALNFKPYLESIVPTENMRNVCNEVEDILKLQFNLVNRGIECFFDEILICNKRKYDVLKKKITGYINDENIRCVHLSMYNDYDIDECLSTNEMVESKILNLCFQRSVIVDRICTIRKLHTSIITYPYVILNFLLDDFTSDLSKQTDCLKKTYKNIKRSMTSCKPLSSDVVVLLSKDVDCISNEILTLEKKLSVLTSEKDSICGSSTMLLPTNVGYCFGMKSK